MDSERQQLAQSIVDQDKKTVAPFWNAKYREEAARNWDIFYKHNTTNFFKDRHWIDREFAEFAQTTTDDVLYGLEIGCGVGNLLFPVLENNTRLFMYACDFSPRAIEFVKASLPPFYQVAFVCDLTQDDLTQNIPTPVQLVSAIFVLSAIPPEKMISALQNVWRVMRPGGVLVIRDYGLYDQAQLRFKPGHKMQDHLYVRSDGTLAYYFSLDRLNEVFTQAGFEPVEEARYVMTEVVNRKREVKMDRVFVQAKFRRPVT